MENISLSGRANVLKRETQSNEGALEDVDTANRFLMQQP